LIQSPAFSAADMDERAVFLFKRANPLSVGCLRQRLATC
jgi:hypothetical protein